jgi:hypothetical protein
MVCGIFVFTYRTAPRSNRMSTSDEFFDEDGRPRNETYPIVDGIFLRQKLSYRGLVIYSPIIKEVCLAFRLIGRPWSGPKTFLSLFRYSSKNCARSRA